MRRTGRRLGDDYLYENEELPEGSSDYETEEYADYSEESLDLQNETEEIDVSANVWKKIGKIALVVIVLIALFFVSMKVTEIWLDREAEPTSYGNDAPDMTEYEDDYYTQEESEEDVKPNDVLEDEEGDSPAPSRPSEEKPEEPTTPEDTEKPKEPTKPSVETPSEEPAPQTPSKPIIVPGNPAA